jgi:TolB-like protein/Tfp pilus assembly protein PilF
MSVGDSPPSRQGADVFISYARADRARVAPLVAALEQKGLSVWWDTHIHSGAAFARTIQAELDAASAVLVLWSAAAIGSDWVRDEASRGRSQNKLVAASLDGSKPPLGFGQYHTVKLTTWTSDPASPDLIPLFKGIAAIKDGSASRTATVEAALDAPKRMDRRVAIAVGGGALTAMAISFGLWRGLRPATASNSVAVLPFADLSGDGSQRYFAEGLAEEVRTALSRQAGLAVAAQTSSARFRDAQDDARSIAKQLRVAYLLEGSVRRAGAVVRVSADLIDGATGFSRWSRSFDRPLADIFAVQSEIATAVMGALLSTLGQSAPVAKSEIGTNNVDAYDRFLRGRALYTLAKDEASDRQALADFDAALVLDPNFAAAHAARARALTVIGNFYAKPGEALGLYQDAKRAASRAIALSPASADAQSTLGYVLFQALLDIKGARAPFEQSARSGAGDATVMARYALYCACTGNAAAARQASAKALQLDPLNPLIHRADGVIAYAARRFSDVAAPVAQALAMNPQLGGAQALLGDALLQLGRTQDARAAFDREPVKVLRLTGQAISARRLGDAKAAAAALAQLRTEYDDAGLYQQAQVLAEAGAQDAALSILERARALGDSGLIFLHSDPYLDGLRRKPRFIGLSASLGFV